MAGNQVPGQLGDAVPDKGLGVTTLQGKELAIGKLPAPKVVAEAVAKVVAESSGTP
jgi:hypothetical protein